MHDELDKSVDVSTLSHWAPNCREEVFFGAPGKFPCTTPPLVVNIEASEGVLSTEYHTCMFPPCERKKFQRLIHNHPLKDGRVISFSTGEEREYPKGFCVAYANGIKDLAADPSFSFLEVFSGPNAPLSAAVAATVGEELSDAKPSLLGREGTLVEGSRTETGAEPRCQTPDLDLPLTAAESKYRKDAISSGKQPSYGKRTQMIADGLNDPIKHLEHAKRLAHPFASMETLKDDHVRAAEYLAGMSADVTRCRLRSLTRLKEKVSALRTAQEQANLSASWTAKKLGLKIQTEAMKHLQAELHIEDKEVPDACRTGLGIIGTASKSNFFEEFEVPPSVSKVEYYQHMHQRSLCMIDRVLFMGRKGGRDLSEAIHQKLSPEPWARLSL